VNKKGAGPTLKKKRLGHYTWERKGLTGESQRVGGGGSNRNDGDLEEKGLVLTGPVKGEGRELALRREKLTAGGPSFQSKKRSQDL